MRLLLALFVLLPAPVLAHDPPGPVPTCQGATWIHEYMPGSSTGKTFDGNIGDCMPLGNPEDKIDPSMLRPCGFWMPCDPCFAAYTPACPLAARAVTTFPAQYDGEPEAGIAAARLFVTDGEEGAYGWGVRACYAAPSRGHHSSRVFAQEASGSGPGFVVSSDYSRAGLETYPECGDGLVEPCFVMTPSPMLVYPLSLVEETVHQLVVALVGPGGDGCNPLDAAIGFSQNPWGPSGGGVPFGAGADGTYLVTIRPPEFELHPAYVGDHADAAAMRSVGAGGASASGGHVWTE